MYNISKTVIYNYYFDFIATNLFPNLVLNCLNLALLFHQNYFLQGHHTTSSLITSLALSEFLFSRSFQLHSVWLVSLLSTLMSCLGISDIKLTKIFSYLLSTPFSLSSSKGSFYVALSKGFPLSLVFFQSWWYSTSSSSRESFKHLCWWLTGLHFRFALQNLSTEI